MVENLEKVNFGEFEVRTVSLFLALVPKGCNFIAPSRTYPAIPYCTIFPILKSTMQLLVLAFFFCIDDDDGEVYNMRSCNLGSLASVKRQICALANHLL